MNIRTANISDILQIHNTKGQEGIQGRPDTVVADTCLMKGACYTEGVRRTSAFENYTRQGWNPSDAHMGQNRQEGDTDSYQAFQQNIQDYIGQVTPDSYEKFSEMGIIPDQENPEDFLTVHERIQIQMAANCENYVPTGSIDIDDIQSMYGNSGRAYEISHALKQRGLNVTSETVEEMEQSLQMAEELKEITPEMAGYLLKNELPLTLEHVYKAQYSVQHDIQNNMQETGGIYRNVTLSDQEWESLEHSITKQMENLGMEVTEETLADARWLVEQQLPVTSENLQKLETIRQLNALGAGEGLAGVSSEQWLYGLAEEAVQVFEKAAAKDVEAIVYEGKEVTLLNMKKVQEETVYTGQAARKGEENTQKNKEELNTEYTNKKIKKELFYLEEIQLTMSVSGFALLMKNGMDIQMSSLKEIAEGLREQNSRQTKALFYSVEQQLGLTENIYTEEHVKLYESSIWHFQVMRTLPVQLLGTVVQGELSFTAASMEEPGLQLQNRLAAAGEAYETMGTKPRKDLGDSIGKAFQELDSMLEQLSMKPTEENKRAVRILAYNEMELTRENIMAVKSLDMEVTRLLENMTPKTAIYLIANGMNPLKTDIRKLNDTLEDINEKIEADTGEHFSEFLWKLDKTKGISKEDRRAFLSIYKALNRLTKHDRGALGRALDASMQQEGGEISLQSLLSAAESFGNHIDTEVNDTSALRYARNLIRESLEHMTPHAMQEMDLQTAGLEEFMEQMTAQQENDTEQVMMQEYYKERILEDAEARHISEQTLKELLGIRITPSIANLMTASAIMGDNGKGFLRMLGWKDKEQEPANQDSDKAFEGLTRDEVKEMGKKLAEALEGEEEFLTEYETISKDLQQELENRQLLWGEHGPDAIGKFSEIWKQNWAVSYVKEAKQEGSYYIPMEIGAEATTLHLTIRKGEDKGRIDVDFETEGLGHVQAILRVSVSRTSMYVSTENENVQAAVRRLEAEQGFVKAEDEGPQKEMIQEEIPAAGVLYQTAKTFLHYMSEIVSNV